MSFDDVYRKHYHELKRFGRQLNIPVELCEDITQETFLRYYSELQKNIVFENPRAWLYKVYLNLFRTSYNRHEERPSEMPPEDTAGIDPQELYADEEKRKIVLTILGTLESREREILILYNRGLAYREIAEILEMNPNSVGKTLVRAIELLRKNIMIHCHELFDKN